MIRLGNRPPLIRMGIPAHKRLLVRNVASRLLHLAISRAQVVLGHPMIWYFALSPYDAKQDPVVYGAEIGVVVLTRVHVLHPYSRASIALAFTTRFLRESATIGTS